MNGLSRSEVEGFCGIRSKEESKCLWDKIDGLSSSTSWDATDYNSELDEIVEDETISSLQWPSQLASISEASKGGNWRDWVVSVIETTGVDEVNEISFNGP